MCVMDPSLSSINMPCVSPYVSDGGAVQSRKWWWQLVRWGSGGVVGGGVVEGCGGIEAALWWAVVSHGEAQLKSNQLTRSMSSTFSTSPSAAPAPSATCSAIALRKTAWPNSATHSPSVASLKPGP